MRPAATGIEIVDQRVEALLVEHQRHKGGCVCGWNKLGASHPGHQAAVLREAGLLRT